MRRSDSISEPFLIVNGREIHLLQGDITELEVDAIVNAANEHLAHGGGVAGAIARKGGPTVQAESDAWVRSHGIVKTGTAAVTGAGRLKARRIIHAVGPVYGSGDEDAKLASAVRAALMRAEEFGLSSVAFPAISTGIFGFPLARCARIMLQVLIDFLPVAASIKRVVICLWDSTALQIFADELRHRQT